MATTSIVAAARAALADLIEAAAGPVQVSYGFPPPEAQQRELIVLAGSTTGTQDDVHLKAGRRTREEDHDNTVVILVASQPQSRESEARAAELAGIVEDILADDPKLGGVNGLIAAWPTGFDIDSGYGPEGVPVTEITMTVRMKSRLT